VLSRPALIRGATLRRVCRKEQEQNAFDLDDTFTNGQSDVDFTFWAGSRISYWFAGLRADFSQAKLCIEPATFESAAAESEEGRGRVASGSGGTRDGALGTDRRKGCRGIQLSRLHKARR